MDAAAPQLRELDAVGGNNMPHEAALAVLMLWLPPELRARAACVCRSWCTAAAHSSPWAELSFERSVMRLTDATLAALCLRAGAALRTLRLDADACTLITGAGLVAALRDGGCTGVRRLDMHAGCLPKCRALTAELAHQLAVACPALQHASCEIKCSLSDAAAASAALPGPQWLECEGRNDEGLTQLAECLRVSTALTGLIMYGKQIGDAGATQLAQCLRFNTTTLTCLSLSDSGIGDAGATQLGETLRKNASLRCLVLMGNDIGAAGVTRLASIKSTHQQHAQEAANEPEPHRQCGIDAAG